MAILFSYLLIGLILLPTSISWAGVPVIIENGKGAYNLSPYLETLSDRENILTIEDIISKEVSGKFTPYGNGSPPHFGFTDSAYWVRFSIKNEAKELKEKDMLLEIALPLLDRIELYIPKADGGFAVKKGGRLLPFNEWEARHRNPLFYIPVDYGDEKTYYIHFKTESAMLLPMTLWTKDSFYRKDDDEYLSLGIYYGIILVMVLYNLFIFLSLKDKNYLFYILCIAAHGLFQLTRNGTAYEYMWPSLPWWNKHAVLFFAMLTIFWAVIFTRSFLTTKEYSPGFDRLLSAMAVLSGLLTVLSLIGDYLIMVKALAVLVIPSTLIMMIAGIICWRKGHRPARYFVAAWSFFLIGTLMAILADISVLPLNFLTWYSMQIGSAFETILLSLALADRINTLREEKRSLEIEAIRAGHLSSIAELSAGVAHEINNPINVIINYAQIMANKLKSLEPGKQPHNADEKGMLMEIAGEIIKEGRRIANTIRNLLSFARQSKGEKILVNITRLLSETLSLMEANLRKNGITLKVDVHRLSHTTADTQQIQQVFFNLINNAQYALNRKYPGYNEDKVLEILGEDATIDNRKHLQITFYDRGIGMPPDIINRITDPFFTTKPRGEGTGLGLSISYNIIKDHGGKLIFDSIEGEFTKATILLPSAEESGG